jgi:hypothetical protein
LEVAAQRLTRSQRNPEYQNNSYQNSMEMQGNFER